MSDDAIDYPLLLRRAFLGLVREVLARTAAEGLPRGHHFFLELRTDHPEVDLPETVRAQHPEQLRIVLQHQFWDLTVDDDVFEVSLSFGGAPARLRVPFDALVEFVDPPAEFALRLPPPGALEEALAAEEERRAAPSPAPDEPAPGEGGTVLPFPRRADGDADED